MSEQLWTFGVEMEFILGEALPGTKIDPKETRTLKFPPTKEAKTRNEEWSQEKHDRYNKRNYANWSRGDIPYRDDYDPDKTFYDVADHILVTLRDAGIKVGLEVSGKPDIKQWQLKDDPSVYAHSEDVPEKYKGIHWHSFEIVSPAFYYDPRSLQEVERLCSLLDNTYIILTNDSIDPVAHKINIAGLHVHVGNGTQEGISLESARRIAAFLWTFEPQLNALHPQIRQDSTWSRGLRNWSRFAQKRLSQSLGSCPSALQGISHFLSCKSFYELTRDVGRDDFDFDDGRKYMLYNFRGLRRRSDASGLPKVPTIEFREAQGTMNGTEVVTWVKTAVEMIDWCVRASPERFQSLLSQAAADEEWIDVAGEIGRTGYLPKLDAIAGQVIMIKGLNAVDLLKHMGLMSQAKFYEERKLYPLAQYVKATEESPFEELRPARRLRPAYKQSVQLAASSFLARRAAAHTERSLGWEQKTNFDPSSKIYPAHGPDLDHTNIDFQQGLDKDSRSNSLIFLRQQSPTETDSESQEEEYIESLIDTYTNLNHQISRILGPIG